MATNGKPTAEELVRLRKQLLIDKGPSSRLQSYQFVYWNQLGDTLGQPFDMTKIPMSKLYQMRRDPMIAFALHYIKVPLITAPWHIQCEDAQIASFVDYALRKIYARLVLQYMLSLDFGFQAVVKRFELDKPVGHYIDPQDVDQTQKPIWSEGNIDAIVWKSFVPLPPEQVEPIWDKSTGEFNGIRYDTKADIPLAFPTQKYFDRDDTVDVPLNLSLWITNEKDSVFGSPWGYPRIGYAFRYWWSYWYRWALADRHFEKDADPPTIVRYPDDPNDESLDDDGNTIDYREVALGMGEQARSGSTIAMPSKLVAGLDDKLSNLYEWDIKVLEGNGNFEVFDSTFDRLEVLKLRSIWVPEQAFLEGSGGTSSRNVAKTLTDNFQESQAVLMGEFDDHLNRYVIPQLVRVNFPEFEGEVKKVTKGFGSSDSGFSKELVQLIGQSDPAQLPVDMRKVLEEHGVPLKTPEIIEAEAQRALDKAVQAATAMGPPDGVQSGPGQAGTTKVATSTGFEVQYVQPREFIGLAEDNQFASRLPKTKHYQDDGILGITKAIRETWKDTYADAYEDFAEYIGRANFAEDDDDTDTDKIVDKILRAWKYSFENTTAKTVANVKKIISRAGQIELRRAKFSTEAWNPNDTAAEWAESHGASLVQGVDQTTRNELKRFLANEIRAGHTNDQIAQNIRDHFSAFPTWKADRLARTETMLAYNFATLFAGQAAGVKRVQALDAKRGSTDEDCEDRNGRIYDITEAFGENFKEHPNGTLSWQLLKSTNLSVEKLPRDQIEDEKLAWYDPMSDTIYMAEDISPEDEERYLIMIGQTLV